MTLAKGKIIRVVCGSYLDRAGAEVAADSLVKNNRNFAAYQRQTKFLSMQMEIALIFRMNGNSNVAEHGLRTRRCHCQKLTRIFSFGINYWVAYLP